MTRQALALFVTLALFVVSSDSAGTGSTIEAGGGGRCCEIVTVPPQIQKRAGEEHQLNRLNRLQGLRRA